MNNFENSDFEKLNGASQPNVKDENNFNIENDKNDGNTEKNIEGNFDGGNHEEDKEKSPEENFVDTEENIEVINEVLLGELSQEEKEELEYNKRVLEDQLQQQADTLIEKEKTTIEEEVKEVICEKLIEELQQLKEEGNLEKLAEELSSEKPVETNTEGPLKEIAQKDPKTALEIINKYLNGSQNILKSIKFGYDLVSALLEKIFKENEEKKGGDTPSVSKPEESSSEEKEEKKDVFQKLAEQRVSGQIEEKRKIRREQREKEINSSSQNFNEDVNMANGGGEPQQTGNQSV